MRQIDMLYRSVEQNRNCAADGGVSGRSVIGLGEVCKQVSGADPYRSFLFRQDSQATRVMVRRDRPSVAELLGWRLRAVELTSNMVGRHVDEE